MTTLAVIPAATTLPVPSQAAAPARRVTLEEMERMAEYAADTKLFPGIETVQIAMTLMMLCAAEGIEPINALRRYHIIKGRPTMRADAMQAEFQRRGGHVAWYRHQPGESNRDFCRATFSHPVHCAEGLEIEVTWEECSAVGNLDMYRKFPAQMLRARCVSQGVRAVMPEIVVGIYTPEEINAGTVEVSGGEVAAPPRSLPSPTPAPAATRYASKETHPLPAQRVNARGLDSRPWHDIPSGEADALNREVAELCEDAGLTPFSALTGAKILNHLVGAVIEASPSEEARFVEEKGGKVTRRPVGQLSAGLGELYRASDWREWLREELATHLADKHREATDRIAREARKVAAGPAIEDESQDTATKPEEESQERPDVNQDADPPPRG